MKSIDRFTNAISKKYKSFLAAIILLTIPLIYFSTKFEINNQIDIFFEEDDRVLIDYKKFRKTYGNDELIVIFIKNEDIFTKNNIALIRNLTNAMKKIKGIQAVFSLTEAMEVISENDTISFRKIIPDDLTEQELEKAKGKILGESYWKNLIISEDGKTIAIVSEILPLSQELKEKLAHLVLETINKIAGEGINIHIVGNSIFEIQMKKLVIEDLYTLAPLVLVIIFIIMIIMLKNFKLTLISISDLMLTFFWTYGLYVLFEQKFNIVMTMMGAILFSIGVADSIHILSKFKDEYMANGGDKLNAIISAIKNVCIPCFFTTITTALSFLSFLTATVRPIKIFGIFASVGVMITLFMTMLLVPALIIYFKDNISLENKFWKSSDTKQKENERSTKALHSIGVFTTSHCRLIGFITLVLIIISLFGIGKIQYETDIWSYLPDDTKLKSDLNFAKKNFGGSIPVEFLIRAKSPDNDFNNHESLILLDEIQNELMKKIKDFTNSTSIAYYFKTMNKVFNDNTDIQFKIPSNDTMIMDFYDICPPELLFKLLSPDRLEARMIFQTRFNTPESSEKQIEVMVNYLDEKLGDKFIYKLTGIFSLGVKFAANLYTSQTRSIIIAFTIIFIIMYFICKSFSLTLLSLIPNIFPVLLILGVMGWAGIKLDVMKIMIASVTIGISVDDTIHFIVWYKRNLESGKGIKESLIMTYSDVGKPIVVTTIILFIGFFSAIFSNMGPARLFGVLTAFAMLFALIGDLLIMPAIILIFKPKQNRHKYGNH